jgi:hypothetical protein
LYSDLLLKQFVNFGFIVITSTWTEIKFVVH